MSMWVCGGRREIGDVMAAKKKPVFGPIRGALEDADPGAGPLVALAQALASELDRQTVAGAGINAALVARYLETVEVLFRDDDGADPIGDLLTKILHDSDTKST